MSAKINKPEPGLYEDKDSGKKLVAQNESLAAAFISRGMVKVGDVPKQKPEKAQKDTESK